jgi:hypothetical protein
MLFGFLPLIKGEIKRGLTLSILPPVPSFIRRENNLNVRHSHA